MPWPWQMTSFSPVWSWWRRTDSDLARNNTLLRLEQAEEENRQQRERSSKIMQQRQMLRHKLEKQQRANECKIQRLTDKLQEAYQQHEALKKVQLANQERIQQQDRLLQQARKEASTNSKRHQEELNRAYNKLNELQHGLSKPLGDDQVIEQMRKLNHNLESWVKTNFRDVSRLTKSDSHIEFPESPSQRRACIHFTVASFMHAFIFVPYRFGLHEEAFARFLRDIESHVQHNCSELMLDAWRIATSIAIDASSGKYREAVSNHIIEGIEDRFGVYSSTDEEPRKRQLRELVQKCVDFKIAVSRQKQLLFFHCSLQGAKYSAQSMTFGGGDAQPDGVVRWSLWPAIMKQLDEGRDVLEPELVWTMK